VFGLIDFCWARDHVLQSVVVSKQKPSVRGAVSNHHGLDAGAQQSLRTTMDLKRCMFFCTTNNLSAIDKGVINRCHLIEMNQATDLSAYLPLANTILTSMGVASTAVSAAVLTNHAKAARGSMRDFIKDVVVTSIQHGGSLRP